MVDRSIIMVCSGGWYLILREYGANRMECCDSRYRIACLYISTKLGITDRERNKIVYGRESACRVEVAMKGNFDRLDVFTESMALDVFETGVL